MTRLDLVGALRELGARAQAELVARLRSGLAAGGGALAPVAPRPGRRPGPPGIATGALLRALASPAALEVRGRSFRLRPAGDVLLRWLVLNAGRRDQPARPVGGLSDRLHRDGAARLAREVRDQVVRQLNDRARGT